MSTIAFTDIQVKNLQSQLENARTLGREDEFLKSLGVNIEKGGKPAQLGEIREFGGKKYQKQANGWRPVKKGDQKSGEKKEDSEYSKMSAADLKIERQAVMQDTSIPYEKKGAMLKEIATALDSKSSKLDLSKHSKQELFDAMRVRVKSGMSESHPEMKQLQAELDKRSSEKSLDSDIEKGAKGVVGEVRVWGGKSYKKQPNGKWLEISERGMASTKPEKGDIYHSSNMAGYIIKISGVYPEDKSLTYYNFLDKSNNEITIKEFQDKVGTGSWVKQLSDKEHSDEEVGLGSKPTIHIGDMSLEQMHAQAAKMGIAGHESMSKKELAKKLVDANIDKQLAEFKARKEAENTSEKIKVSSSYGDFSFSSKERVISNRQINQA